MDEEQKIVRASGTGESLVYDEDDSSDESQSESKAYKPINNTITNVTSFEEIKRDQQLRFTQSASA